MYMYFEETKIQKFAKLNILKILLKLLHYNNNNYYYQHNTVT